MQFFVRAHQHKAQAYISALEARGHVRVHALEQAAFALYDHDIWHKPPYVNPELARLHERGAKVFIYPHGARPALHWDMYEGWPHLTAQFVIARGHVEVMRAYGYAGPLEMTGWTYCDVRAQPPSGALRSGHPRVVFAPLHPNGNGYMHPPAEALNRQVHTALVALAREERISLTVRHIGRLDVNGLTDAKLWNVGYVQATPNGSTSLIETADVVVAGHTYAYMAAALGKPLVMMGDSLQPYSGISKQDTHYARQWEKYRDIMRYPFNFEDWPDGLLETMQAACKPSRDVENWQARFIGEPFNGGRFVKKLEAYL